ASGLDGCGAENQLWTEGSLVHEPVVDDSSDTSVVENPSATAQAGLAIAEDVIGKSDPRREIVQAGIDAVGRHAWVAGKIRSRRSVGELRRTDSGDQAVNPELLNPAFQFAPGQSRFVAQSQVDCQPPSYANIVLAVDTGKRVAVILKFPCALAEGEIAAVVAQRSRQESVDPVEAELCRLEKQIVEVHPAAFDDSAKTEIMPALYPTDI